VLEGDRNTSFFHTNTIFRRNRNAKGCSDESSVFYLKKSLLNSVHLDVYISYGFFGATKEGMAHSSSQDSQKSIIVLAVSRCE
jgi:hypothetical protein